MLRFSTVRRDRVSASLLVCLVGGSWWAAQPLAAATVVADVSADWSFAYGNGVAIPDAQVQGPSAPAGDYDGPEQGLPDTQGSGNWQFGNYTTIENPGTFTRLPDFNIDGPFQYWGTGGGIPLLYRYPEGQAPAPDAGGQFAGHPGGSQDAALRWTSGVSGLIDITGTLRKRSDAAGQGDGVYGRIYHNGTEIYEQLVNTAEGVTLNEQITVAAGDTLDFVLNMNGNSNNDSSLFTPTISLVPEPATPLLLTLGMIPVLLRRRRGAIMGAA